MLFPKATRHCMWLFKMIPSTRNSKMNSKRHNRFFRSKKGYTIYKTSLINKIRRRLMMALGWSIKTILRPRRIFRMIAHALGRCHQVMTRYLPTQGREHQQFLKICRCSPMSKIRFSSRMISILIPIRVKSQPRVFLSFLGIPSRINWSLERTEWASTWKMG